MIKKFPTYDYKNHLKPFQLLQRIKIALLRFERAEKARVVPNIS